MTDELIESIINNFPAGTLLRVKNGQELLFQPRAFQGAPILDGTRPAYLILDGQQRLTSLYQAFYGAGSHRFYLDLAALETGTDLEDAAFYERSDKAAKTLGQIEEQAASLIFPMGQLFGGGGFDGWLHDVLRTRGGSADQVLEVRQRLANLRQQWLKPVEDYDFPMVTLAEDTDGGAICTIFETLNRTGVKLGVFDLLTARFWPKSVNLRALWEKARADNAILDEFQVDPYYVLQIVNLVEPGNDKDGRPKAASIKRGEILSQSAMQVQAGWERAVAGLTEVLRIFREDCGVAIPKWLPYTTMVIPAAAAWAAQKSVAHAAQVGGNRGKLVRWFWCASLGQRYDTAPNTRAARDFVELRRWMIEPDADPPESVASFRFDASALRGTTFRQRALYRAMMALALRRGPLDFHKRGSITTQLLSDVGNPVDDHHVFPQGFLPQGVPPVLRDSILNRTLIDRITNIRIGKRAPSDYLAEIRGAWGGAAALDELLGSHLLPTGDDSSLMRDDFDAFLGWREQRLAQEIETVTGVPVQRGLPEPGTEATVDPAGDMTATEAGVALPPAVIALVDMRASAWVKPLAERFASNALSLDGVELRAQIRRYSDWIMTAYDEPNRDKSLAGWQKVFGPGFKAPTKAAAVAESVTKSAAALVVRAPGEEDIRSRFPVVATRSARITGKVLPKAGFRAGLVRDIGRLHKDRELRFRVDTDVGWPYDVYWKVRNFGDEAERAHGLRGQLMKASDPRGWHRETTLYTGTHWIEAYVVKEGTVRATDRHIVRIA